MSGAIKPPSGKPFDIIGTDNAMDAVAYLNGNGGTDGSREVYELYNVIADRDHLYHQVTMAQAATTAEVLARRKVEATLRGAMSYVYGDGKDDSNPYDRLREETLWTAWIDGYSLAQSKHDLSWRSYAMEARYAGSLAAAAGDPQTANPHTNRTNMRAWWAEGYVTALRSIGPRLFVTRVGGQFICANRETPIAKDHPATTLPLTGTYEHADKAGGWLGWIEPADKAWLAFVAPDGAVCLWQDRRPEDGAVLGNPVLLRRAPVPT